MFTIVVLHCRILLLTADRAGWGLAPDHLSQQSSKTNYQSLFVIMTLFNHLDPQAQGQGRPTSQRCGSRSPFCNRTLQRRPLVNNRGSGLPSMMSPCEMWRLPGSQDEWFSRQTTCIPGSSSDLWISVGVVALPLPADPD